MSLEENMGVYCKECFNASSDACTPEIHMEALMEGRCMFRYYHELQLRMVKEYPEVPVGIIYDLSRNMIESEKYLSFPEDRIHMRELLACWDKAPEED